MPAPVPVLKSALQTGSHTHTRNARVDGVKAVAMLKYHTGCEPHKPHLRASIPDGSLVPLSIAS